jgi:hypothetical protein
MDESMQETVAIKACAACASGLLERDRFCRMCGALQPDQAGLAAATAEPRTYMTSRLSTGLAATVRGEVYHRVSEPLVEAVLTGALSGHSGNNESPVLKRLMLALISIPVWLIIVLLSPLDAYAAVRNLARQA